MSFAPRDSHEAQVQFALERGVPAVIGVLGTIETPYPSSAFDMAHCSRCLIPWGVNGKIYYICCLCPVPAPRRRMIFIIFELPMVLSDFVLSLPLSLSLYRRTLYEGSRSCA